MRTLKDGQKSGTQDIHVNLFADLCPVFEDELVDVKLPLAALAVHEANLAEDVPLTALMFP